MSSWVKMKNSIGMAFVLVCWMSVFLSFACTKPTDKVEDKKLIQIGEIGYNLNRPSKAYYMPSKLTEISGLSFYKKELLACVQDEVGKLFIYDLKKEEVVSFIKFADGGDYEGVEIVGKDAFVIESNGNLFHIKNFEKELEVNKINTPLSPKNDIEGLGIDPENDLLLIACKEKPYLDADHKHGGKSIFAYRYTDNTFIKAPVHLLKKSQVSEFVEENSGYELSKEALNFKPSAVAVHPKTDQTYVIASAGKLLLVLSPDGSINALSQLNPKIYQQPEGLAFSPNGDMFIASEGKTGKGYILKFEYKKP